MPVLARRVVGGRLITNRFSEGSGEVLTEVKAQTPMPLMMAPSKIRLAVIDHRCWKGGTASLVSAGDVAAGSLSAFLI